MTRVLTSVIYWKCTELYNQGYVTYTRTLKVMSSIFGAYWPFYEVRYLYNSTSLAVLVHSVRKYLKYLTKCRVVRPRRARAWPVNVYRLSPTLANISSVRFHILLPTNTCFLVGIYPVGLSALSFDISHQWGGSNTLDRAIWSSLGWICVFWR